MSCQDTSRYVKISVSRLTNHWGPLYDVDLSVAILFECMTLSRADDPTSVLTRWAYIRLNQMIPRIQINPFPFFRNWKKEEKRETLKKTSLSFGMCKAVCKTVFLPIQQHKDSMYQYKKHGVSLEGITRSVYCKLNCITVNLRRYDTVFIR